LLVDATAAGVIRKATPGFAVPDWAEVTLDRAAARTWPLSADEAQACCDLYRLALAHRALGAARRAFELVTEHARTRRQFMRPIGASQAVQHKLADQLIALDGVRLLLGRATAHLEASTPDRPVFVAAAVAAADALRQAMLECQHVFGAIGYAEEHECPQLFRRVHADLVLLGGVRAARSTLANHLLGPGAGELPADDLGIDEPLLAFRTEIRRWLSAHWTDADRDAHERLPQEVHEFDGAFSRKVGQRGWIGLSWPKAAGGQARSPREQLVFLQEMERAGAPISYHLCAEHLIGPALVAFGSAEQQQRFVPSILRGECSICLGYSEPEAGSDLASLRTTAVRDGDDWIVNGQKLWTTAMEHADHIWLAARTDPNAASPHAGISVFLVPLDLPGITRRRNVAFYGKPFWTTFWDDVRVPAHALVGEVNGGWKVITSALANERLTMGARVSKLESLFRQVCLHVAAQHADDAVVRDGIGRFGGELALAKQLVERTATLMHEGKVPLHEAAMCKVYSSELMERLSESMVTLLGPAALLDESNPDAPCGGRIQRMLRTSIMMVVGGGTNEIQRTLIATRGLGLPSEAQLMKQMMPPRNAGRPDAAP
ncbi:MAG TPA: acyl-CoA dehydrogenase family protein, partial [Nevskiaceae bacterium]|nr:acyl-CoA dehydrogenase family protein [Nevskiaceae bacterium]